jgi:hypothetical protein
MWQIVIGIACGSAIALTFLAFIHWDSMKDYRCGTTESWCLAPCIDRYIKAIDGWADYIMHYPIITNRKKYTGRWVICKQAWYSSAGKMSRFGIHRAGKCPHSVYRTIEEHREIRKKETCV